MALKNKLLIALACVAVIAFAFFGLYSAGIISFGTASDLDGDGEDLTIIYSIDDLENNRFYVWHNPDGSLTEDLSGTTDLSVFTVCPIGTVNWGKNEYAHRTIWFNSVDDWEIPTLFPGDSLIYISNTSVPGQDDDGKIHWERFADYGYTIGITSLVEDESGHYYLPASDSSDNILEGYVDVETDALDIAQYQNFVNSRVYIDQVGSIDIRSGLVSDGGTILNLDEGKEYLCKLFKGTYVSDFKLTASVHAFSSLESFDTFDWEFIANDSNLNNIHSCIEITLPPALKTGYYYVGGIGLFRYVSIADLSVYNGYPYDPNVNWNDPIIIRDELGNTIYNPFTGLDDREKYKMNSGANENSDVGAEGYEDLEEEE